jgi:putative ABC transport system ATP-binding protein
MTKVRRKHIGFVFQFFNLLPMLTAEENIVLPLSLAGEKPDKEWIDGLIDEVGLTQRRSHRPAELSGGQQQRVAIGRALVSRPDIIFADEPTGNLDSKTSGEILELLERSVRELNQTIVMVTHEARAAAIADRILFLDDGLIVREARDISAHDIVAAMEELGAS